MTFPNHKGKYLSKPAFTAKDWNEYRGFGKKYRFPSKYIIAYFPYSKKYFLKKHPSKKIRLYQWLTVHVHGDIGFVLITGSGAPNVSAIMEELIALGGKYFINTGTAGGLKKTGTILCTKALMDEGVSHHYVNVKENPYSHPDKELTKRLEQTLIKNKIEYNKGPSWTTDAPYMETKAEFEKYRKEGIYTVEMEASAMFTIGKKRKAKVASIFVISDVLFHKSESKFHRFNTKKGQKQIIDVAYDCLKNIKR